jgi:hypothetical protein
MITMPKSVMQRTSEQSTLTIDYGRIVFTWVHDVDSEAGTAYAQIDGNDVRFRANNLCDARNKIIIELNALNW